MKTKQIIEIFFLALLVFITSISLYKILWMDKKIDNVEYKLSNIQKNIDDWFIIVVD